MGSENTPRADALVGRIMGPYRVTARLRETGGVTSVIAEHLHLDRHVLLKWLHPASAAVLDRVREQARGLSRLKHRNVLPVIDVGESEDGFVYLAFELSGGASLGEGAPLRSVVKRRKALPWWEARSLGRQVASVVRAAQAAALPLAEVSPSAVFLMPEDNGAAGVRVDLATPELLGVCDPSLVADQVHGLGRVLYLMVTGHDASPLADQPPADPVLSWPELEIPTDADALIMRALDPVAANRWDSLEILERELGGGDAEEAAPLPDARPGAWGAGARFTDARFSEALRVEPDFSDDNDVSTDDRSFGRRVFARPSKRALISGGVAVAAGTVLLALIVTSQKSSTPEGELGARSVAVGGASGSPAEKPARGAVKDTSPAVVNEGTAIADGASPGWPQAAVVGAGDAAVAAAPGATTLPGAAAPGLPAPGALPGAGAAALPGQSAVATGATLSPGPAAVTAAPGRGPAPTAASVPGGASASASASASSPAPARSAGAPAPTASAGPGAPAAPAPVPGAGPANAVTLPGLPAGPTGGGPPAVAPPGEPAVFPPSPGACVVSLGSRPWADVWLDGRRVGFTPLSDLAVTCGPHDIVFTSSALGVERRISITARPGEQVKRIVDLEGAPMGVPGLASEGTGGAGASVGCRLSLGSRPWSEVWVDGKRAGITPLVSMTVACGKHDLLFLSREANVEHRESVLVRSGQPLKRVVTLVEGD